MTAIDTNILVRYFIRDDEFQFIRVRTFFFKMLDQREILFISDAVLCELIWVLSRGYRHTKTDIVQTLELLSKSAGMSFQNTTGLRNAITAYKSGRGDFADYLIRERGVENGCQMVVTFDKALLNEPGFIEP